MGKLTLSITLALFAFLAFSLIPHPAKAYPYEYSFVGPFDEDTGVLYPLLNVTIIVYFKGYPNETKVLVAGNIDYYPARMPSYFDFDLGYIHRQHWLSPDETAAFIDVFNTTELVNVTVKFQDLSGVLVENATYCEAFNAEREYDHIVEKQKVDAEKKAVFHLKMWKTYDFKLLNNGTYYDYGNVVITGDTVNLVVKPLDFPSDIVLAYQYVRMYGTRDFSTPTGSITLDYEDTLSQTTAFTYTILLDNGTVILPPVTFYGLSTVVSTWMGAANNTGYTVKATIVHSQFGSMTWNHYYPREFSSPPFSLDWMGTWPITSSAVIPAFLILFAFGSFSVLNAYVGAFFGMVTASLLSYWGWLVIPSQMLVLGWVLAILVGVAANKRRLFT